VIDIDGDNDLDVLASGDNTVSWYENDGSLIFNRHFLPWNYGAWGIYAIDLDGDNDTDVLSTYLGDDKVFWYENQGTSSIELEYEPGIPDDFELYDNYPNPFNPVTNIEFDVMKSAYVVLKVYDIQGREVTTLVDKQLTTGHYKVTFNAEELSSGIYLYKIRMDDFYAIKKMTLIK
jgi:hypothetical protein